MHRPQIETADWARDEGERRELKIELSQFEVELLDQALSVWEKEPSSDAAMGGILGALFAGMAGRENPEAAATIKSDGKQMREQAEKTVQKRRLQAALLRAKLLQSLAINSEHSFDENPANPPPPRWNVNEHCFN